MLLPDESSDNSQVSIVPALVLLASIAFALSAICGTLLGSSIWVALGFFYTAALIGCALVMAGFAVSAFVFFQKKSTGYIQNLNEGDVLFLSLAPSFTRSEVHSTEMPGHSHIIELLNFGDLRRCLMKYHHSRRIAIIDDEGFDIYELIEKLLLLRTSFPNLKIILLSDNVSADDFSATRAPVCDVTLKKPISPQRLALGIEAVDRWA